MAMTMTMHPHQQPPAGGRGDELQGAGAWREHVHKSLGAQEELLDTLSATLEGHRELRDVVAGLPQRTSHRVMVPLSARAFVPGRLVHPNELTVHLGSQIYAARTAAQTADILQRRMDVLEGEAAGCRERMKLLQEQLEVAANVAVNNDGHIDIQEEYEEGVHGAAAPAAAPTQPSARKAAAAEPDADFEDMLARMERLERLEAESGELGAGRQTRQRGGRAVVEGTVAEGLPPGWTMKLPQEGASNGEGASEGEGDSDDDPDFVPPEAAPRGAAAGGAAPPGILRKGFLSGGGSSAQAQSAPGGKPQGTASTGAPPRGAPQPQAAPSRAFVGDVMERPQVSRGSAGGAGTAGVSLRAAHAMLVQLKSSCLHWRRAVEPAQRMPCSDKDWTRAYQHCRSHHLSLPPLRTVMLAHALSLSLSSPLSLSPYLARWLSF